MVQSDNVRFNKNAKVTFDEGLDSDMQQLIQSIVTVATDYVNRVLDHQIDMHIESAINRGEGVREQLELYKLDSTVKKLVGGAMVTAFVNASLLSINNHAETVAQTDCWLPPTTLPGRDALVLLAYCNMDADPVPVDIALGDYKHDTQEFVCEDPSDLTPGVKLVGWKWAYFGPEHYNAMYPSDEVAHVQLDDDSDAENTGESS